MRSLAAVVGTLALCAPASAMTPEAARTAAAAINLVPGDVPGFEAQSMPKVHDDDRVPTGCPRFDRVARNIVASQLSDDFFRSGGSNERELHSQVDVLRSVPAAERVVSMLRSPRMPSCLERMLRVTLRGQLHVTRIVARRVAVPVPTGALGFRTRAGYVYSGRHGISVSELRCFRRGPALVTLETSAPNQPAAPSLVDPLLRLLARRAAAALP